MSGKQQLYKVVGLNHSPAPMILADTLSIAINLLLVAHVVISLLLILVVLMQRPKQEGLGAAFGGGMTDQMFGAQTTNVLQKGTVYLGAAFLILSLVLAILIGNKNNTAAMAQPASDKVEEVPVVPAALPAALPDGGSIKDELDKTGEATPADSESEPVAPEAGADAADPPSGEEDAPAPDPSAGDAEGGSTDEGSSVGGDEEDAVSPAGDASEDKPE